MTQCDGFVWEEELLPAKFSYYNHQGVQLDFGQLLS
jgi:hypothetical protein